MMVALEAVLCSKSVEIVELPLTVNVPPANSMSPVPPNVPSPAKVRVWVLKLMVAPL